MTQLVKPDPWPFLTVLIILILNQFSDAQLVIGEGQKRGFDGTLYEVYQLEGEHVVIHVNKTEITEEQLKDTAILGKILERTDLLYEFYLTNMGYEPYGGNPEFGNKADVLFTSAESGGGLGLVGAKGIEVTGFNNLFYNLKYDLNVNRDVIIGYEFGRNFFTFSNKILFPYDQNTNEKNGGFAEAFAGMMYMYAFDQIITEPAQREINETILNLRWNMQRFRGYINDDSCTPYNTLANWEKIGTLDPNRGTDGWNDYDPAYNGGAILVGIFETLGKEKLFPEFFTHIKNCNSVQTIEDALSNIALSASKSVNGNLVPFFKNVLRFNLNPDTESLIESFPPIESKLIRDEQVLWFVSPFDTITLNLKSTTYLADSCEYQITKNGEIISRNVDGRNKLDNSILDGKSELEITCQLLKNDAEIDNFKIILKKRHDFRLFDYRQEFYSSTYNEKTRCGFQGDDLIIEALDKESLCGTSIFYNFVFSRNRTYYMTAEIRHTAIPYKEGNPLIHGFIPTGGVSAIGFVGPINGGRSDYVGWDVGRTDTTNFYSVSIKTYSDDSMPKDGRKYFMNRIHIEGQGIGQKIEVRNLHFYDITDTDGDGFVDFEDNCPSEYGTNFGCPALTIIKEDIENEFHIYPNPSKNQLFIKTNKFGVLHIYDIHGKLIQKRQILDSVNEIDVSDFIPSVYLIKFQSGKIVKTIKFIKN
jgi:hypothetical protein